MLHEPDAPYKLPRSEPRSDQILAYERDEDEPLLEYLRRRLAAGAWKLPAILFVVGAVVFSLFAWDRVSEQSADPHFVYLANTLNTMVAAQFDDEAAEKREDKHPFELDRDPPHNNDWASWWDITTRDGEQFQGYWLDQQGHGRFMTLDEEVYFIERDDIDYRERTERHFVSFPPGPAILMMPLAAIWDYDVNDVWFTIFFAALNVVLMYLLLRRLSVGGRSGRGRSDNLWLTVLFAFGTAHLWCSVLGQVWFTALIVGVTFALLYMLCAIDARHPLLAGIFLALGFATRTPLVFTAIFFFAFVFFPGGKWRKGDWGVAFKKLALFCTPCLIVGIGLLWINDIRFGSPTEFGHTFLAGGTLARIQDWGLFNVHFLEKNLKAMLALLPQISTEAPYVTISKHGLSLFLTTPAFLWLFFPKKPEARRDWFLFILLLATVAVTLAPAILYQNTGYEQFGFRFSLDFTPYLIVLLAVGRRPFGWLFKAAVIAGIAVNAFGGVTFKRFGEFYTEEFFL
ncbi:MAG: hypothetical protein ACOCV2_07620 [Persicimonas sp.]